MVPLDPDAMVTALVKAEGLVKMIICNLQLYSITLYSITSGSIPMVLLGKKFLQNVRAMGMVV